MKPRISVITLAVDDLQKALEFYRDGLGLPSEGIIGTEYKSSEIDAEGSIALFELQGGLYFCLYPRTELAKDANRPVGSANPTEFSLGYAVNSMDEVDAFMRQAKEAGATITDEPRNRPWGIYSGYFQDLDGHLWEVLWNPALELNEGIEADTGDRSPHK